MHRFYIFMLISLLFIWGCDSPNEVKSADASGEWLIPSDEIYDGGPGKDGIPALTDPDLIPVSAVGYLRDSDLVIGVKVGNDSRAYPHAILDWHEIINDDIGSASIAITYCPLTGSGIGWDRFVNGSKTTFGVSGLLYNSNLIPYDRATDTEWSQMKLQAVHGELAGQTVQTHPVLETTWATWKTIAPNSPVVSTNTGYNRSYGTYPYGDYRTNHNNLIFPVSERDNRLPAKQRVLGVLLQNAAKAYPIAAFGNGVSVIQESLDNTAIVVAGSQEHNFAVAFERQVNGEVLMFEALNDQLPLILKDEAGNSWNIWGQAVDGPDKGATLKSLKGYTAYWFAWAAFWPGTELHK
mgnify:FL=1